MYCDGKQTMPLGRLRDALQTLSFSGQARDLIITEKEDKGISDLTLEDFLSTVSRYIDIQAPEK